MYLASLYICFDLDPSLPAVDKDRLLLSLREKLKQKFKNRLTVKIDEHENALAIAFFENNYEKMKQHFYHILEQLEASSEARINFQQEQAFYWFEGQFIDVKQNKIFDLTTEKNNILLQSRRTYPVNEIREKTIIYTDSDDDEQTPLPSRFTRRHFRIPTRK